MVLSIKDIMMILWSRKVTISLFTIICCGLFVILGIGIEKTQYTATGSIYVYNEENRVNYDISTGELSASQQLVSTYIVVLRSNNVLKQVSEQLENYDLTTSQIRDMLSANAINSTEAFNVSVTCEDKVMAQEVCNTILKVAPDEIVRVVKAGSVEVIDWAELPEEAHWNIKKYIFLGIVLGLVLGVSYVLLRFIFDITIYDETMLVENFELPVIGTIPTELWEDADEKSSLVRGEYYEPQKTKKRKRRV